MNPHDGLTEPSLSPHTLARGPARPRSREGSREQGREDGSPDLRTSFSTREPGETNRVIRNISYADALTRVITELRPLWDPDKVRHEIINDPRPDGIAAPAAIFAACDPAMHEPGSISRYRPATQRTEPPVTFPVAPRCEHGTLADPDGRGTDCDGCGTRATPPDPALLARLRAAASGPTRHVPEDA